MRIAFLTSEYGNLGRERGGLGYYLARLVPQLAESGHECEVFLSSGHSDEEGCEIEEGSVSIRHLAAAEPSPFDSLLLPRQVRHHLRSAWTIARAFDATSRHAPFDVVQVPNYGISGLFVESAVPMVMRFSSHAPTWHRAACAPRDNRTVLGEMLQRHAIRAADAHYAPSRFVGDVVQKEYGLPVQVVRSPMPRAVDRPAWDDEWVQEVAAGRPYLLHAGQLGPAKGTHLVTESAHLFLAGAPDLHLHFCGRDVGAHARIADLEGRFPGRVHWHGRVAPRRLHALMAQALAVLAPSRADNLPNVVIEAMSLGTPVIGTRGASIDELIVDGKSGVLIPPDDANALVAAVRDLYSWSPERRRALGNGALERVLSLLNETATVDPLVELFDRTSRIPTRSRPARHALARRLRNRLRAAILFRKATLPVRAQLRRLKWR